VAESLLKEALRWASAGTGSKGNRLYDWACALLSDPDTAEAGRW
jgi:SRSO17 transposase